MDVIQTAVGKGYTSPTHKFDAWFIQLINGETLLAAEVSRTVNGTYLLKKPIRLLVQREGGRVAVGFAPMIPFMQKSAQTFNDLEIQTSSVLWKDRLSKVINDGEVMARGYHEEVSGIALV